MCQSPLFYVSLNHAIIKDERGERMALPKLGQQLFIMRMRDRERGDAHVLDISQTAIVFELPLSTNSNTLLALDAKDPVLISYFAVDGSLQQFETTIHQKIAQNELQTLQILTPKAEEIRHIQRRSFVRVPANFAVAFLVPKREGGIPLVRGKGLTHDISGGGIRFHPESDVPVVAGDTITVQFSLPKDAPTTPAVSAKGIVLRLKPHELLSIPILSIRFTEISNAAQQRIVQYAFKRQLELRAKGLE